MSESKEVPGKLWVKCEPCDGRGFLTWDKGQPLGLVDNICQRCQGRGQVAVEPEPSVSLVGSRPELTVPPPEQVDHPTHYGGKDDPYEACKVIEAWGLGWHLGDVLKYIRRAGHKESQAALLDLRKAAWYLSRKIELMTKEQQGNG